MNTKTQCQQVRSYLENYGSITPLEALNKLGVFRLGARIYDLRTAGISIETERFETSGGAVIAKYILKQRRVQPITEQVGLFGASA